MYTFLLDVNLFLSLEWGWIWDETEDGPRLLSGDQNLSWPF